MDGLSSDKLRMLLHPVDEDDLAGGNEASDDETSGGENSDGSDDENAGSSGDDMDFDFRDNVVLATLQDGTRGKWMEAQVMYSFAKPHKVRLPTGMKFTILYKKMSQFLLWFFFLLLSFFFLSSSFLFFLLLSSPFFFFLLLSSSFFFFLLLSPFSPSSFFPLFSLFLFYILRCYS